MRRMPLFFLLMLLMALTLASCAILPEEVLDRLPEFMRPSNHGDAATVSATTAAPATTSTPAATRQKPAINGNDLAQYTVLTDEASSKEAELFVSLIEATYGIELKTAEEADGLAIRFAQDDTVKLGRCEIRNEDKGIAVYGRGVNATYLAAMGLLDAIADVAATPEKNLVIDSEVSRDASTHLPAGTMDILTATGAFNRKYKGDLNVAFLGGSLTQDKTGWTNCIVKLLEDKLPYATVNTLNAGIGATDSECGAMRLEKDVLSKMTPDILFIDYAVNDGGFTTRNDAAILENGAYIESIIRQCRELPEPPIIILLFFPLGQRGNATSQTYVKWKNGVDLKREIAENYGIGTVDVWAWFEALYREEKIEDPSLTYEQFLSAYYSSSDRTHPKLDGEGYKIFGDAIVNAIKNDPEGYLLNKVIAEPYLKDFEDITGLSYTLLSPTDVLPHADGSFTHITVGTKDTEADDYVPGIRISKSQLSEGVLAINDGSDFTITVTTSAKALKLYGINSPAGMKIEILADGILCGTVDTKASNTYLYTGGVPLPEDGEEHTIVIRPAADNTGTVFRFGYIALGE